ncbi:hypothetical protein H6F86_21205 [Phormidium sp. FACHB-592]|uniref:Uncharacterized protein n=1 Tax=Stenomitos frigidus AS-A4 TaxID=2933935 RepID=A0ABV0KEU3_9CYAN|nr:hypothetical protein [Phormidium sp. FACHB-592]MBD2076354.1 hypothetical protein [Phormidium sp. FACHB-592]
MSHFNTTLPEQLPPKLLARLREPQLAFTYRRSLPAMKAAARLFGIKTRNTNNDPRCDWYNLTLQALDNHTPDWRGYLLPVEVKTIAQALPMEDAA